LLKSLNAVLVSVVLLAGFAAKADTPLQDYLSRRDKAIQSLDRDSEESLDDEDQKALADLEKRLISLIGPVDLRGFKRESKIHLQTLQKGMMGFGLLDGFSYTGPDETQVVVTTKALLNAWLKANETPWNSETLPQEMASALKSEVFYTKAIGGDAAIARFADIPVSAPSGDGVAYAMLSMWRQDYGPQLPDQIVVSVLQGEKLFILMQPTSAKIQKIAACNQIWDRYQKEASKASAAYHKSQDEAHIARSNTLEKEGDRQFRACFAQKFKDQAAYQAVVRQAQELVRHLPSP
jgi:hypothetical protein